MAYEKQNFVDGAVLTAAQLNHIEDGFDLFPPHDSNLCIEQTIAGGTSHIYLTRPPAATAIYGVDNTYETTFSILCSSSYIYCWGYSGAPSGYGGTVFDGSATKNIFYQRSSAGYFNVLGSEMESIIGNLSSGSYICREYVSTFSSSLVDGVFPSLTEDEISAYVGDPSYCTAVYPGTTAIYQLLEAPTLKSGVTPTTYQAKARQIGRADIRNKFLIRG